MSIDANGAHAVTIAEQVAALGSMPTAQLAAEYERVVGRKPRYRSVPWLRKRIAHALQVAAYGGLSRVARAVVDELAKAIVLPAEPKRPARGEPQPGSVLRREWREQTIEVHVVEDGFVWRDAKYGSLSAVAFAVTNSKWNGKLFFNLVERKAKG